MKRSKENRFVSLALSLAMALTMVPWSSFADTADNNVLTNTQPVTTEAEDRTNAGNSEMAATVLQNTVTTAQKKTEDKTAAGTNKSKVPPNNKDKGKPAEQNWEVSKSKEATNLDEDYVSNITLSLPSAQENLKTDIVFVFDESSCSTPVKESVGTMIQDLYGHVDKEGAAIRIGAVQFRGETTEFALSDLNDTTKDSLADFLGKRPKTGGSNMSMGIKAGEKMLDEDKDVEANRKYMILVSDGITYIWDDLETEEQENYGVNFSNVDTPDNPFLASPDGWDVKHKNGFVPADWESYLNEASKLADKTINEKASEYVRGKDISRKPFIKSEYDKTLDERGDYLSTVDIALLKSREAYDAVKGKYHTFINASGVPGEMACYPYGPSFMDYLAGGKSEVSFDGIKKDIEYLVATGSKVVDKIGYVKDDYDFDFINKAERISLTISDKIYKAIEIKENKYGFKSEEDGFVAKKGINSKYAFTLTYNRNTGQEDEELVWDIFEPVSNFARVSLDYAVQLVNPKKEPGEYGKYDQFGENNDKSNKFGLYTNNSAVLEYVSTDGTKGIEEFNKPTVFYKVEDNIPGIYPINPISLDEEDVSVNPEDSAAPGPRDGLDISANPEDSAVPESQDDLDISVDPKSPTVPENPKVPDSPEDSEETVNPEKPEDPEEEKAPKTGDESNIVLLTAVALIALGGLAAVEVIRRKENM